MIGRNHIYFCFTKVRMDVLVLWIGDDDGMINGILLCLVYPLVQGGHVHVFDLFTMVLVVISIIVTDIQNSILIVLSNNCKKSLNRNTVFCTTLGKTFKSCGNVIGIVNSKAMKISNSS